MIELGRPSKMGIIVFGTGEGSFGTQKSLADDVVDKNGNAVDFSLDSGSIGFLMQFRSSATATFRYSRLEGEVTQTADEGIFWTSKPNQPDGETGISVDTNGASDRLNIYVASSAANQVVEIRIWQGYA